MNRYPLNPSTGTVAILFRLAQGLSWPHPARRVSTMPVNPWVKVLNGRGCGVGV